MTQPEKNLLNTLLRCYSKLNNNSPPKYNGDLVEFSSGLIVNTKKLDYVYNCNLHLYISRKATAIATYLPKPKEGMTNTDVVILALVADKYSFNPLTYQEPHWLESKFQSLWSSIHRMCINDTNNLPLNTVLEGRTPSGYSNARCIVTYQERQNEINSIPVDEIEIAIGSNTTVMSHTTIIGLHDTVIDVSIAHISKVI